MNNEFDFQSNVPNPYEGFAPAQPQKKKKAKNKEQDEIL